MIDSKPMRILVVDDDPDEFVLFQDYIERTKLDAIIEWAGSYNRALSMITSINFDVFVVDYYLGIKTGIDLLKEIKSRHMDQPVILLTGQGNRKVDRAALKSGAADYLVKHEINPVTLERSLRYAFSRHQANKQAWRERQRYISLFENSPLPIILCDPHFRAFETNPAFESVFGLSASSESPIYLGHILKEYDLVEQLRESAQYQGLVEGHKCTIPTHSGLKSFLISVSLIGQKDGEEEGFHVIFSDTSDVRIEV